ncbi:hypothetical protein CR513_38744, partial [Mucuna pruriens]
GLPIEEPLANWKEFLNFIDTMKINNVPMDTICLGLFLFLLVDNALNGLFTLNQTSIDVACGETIRKKSLSRAYGIIEDMAFNNYHCSLGDKHVTKRLVEEYQVEARGVAQTHFMPLPPPTCEQYGTTIHENKDYRMNNLFTKAIEKENFINGSRRSQNNPYSSHYNLGWREHLNFS